MYETYNKQHSHSPICLIAFEMHFNIVLLSVLTSPKFSLSFRLSDQSFTPLGVFCPAQAILFVLSEDYTLWSSSLCNFLKFHVHVKEVCIYVCTYIHTHTHTHIYIHESVSKGFRTGHLERELQTVQLSATRCSFIAIL